jgi:hypothetical protein
MDLRQGVAEVGDETAAGVGVVVVALDLAGDGLSLDRFEDHERHAVIAPSGVDEFGNGHTAAAGSADHTCLDQHVALVTGTLTLQDERPTVGREAPGLA